MTTISTLKRTSLYNEHLKLNAKIVPFGGWEMPLQYDGILAEYNETRNRLTVFDISHMGEFIVEGDAVLSGLDKIVTPSIAAMPIGSCRYGAMLNESGGVLDDLIVFRIQEKEWMIVVNGATIEKDTGHFQKHITDKGSFKDISDETGKLDIQGPDSREVLISLVEGIEKLDYYTFDKFEVLGKNVIVSRTGYTGELGYEIYFPSENLPDLWNEILKRGVKPAGLGARDVLRIEMCYSLYGHELGEKISPIESGLSRFIDWEKDFIGKESLLLQKSSGARRKIACIVSETRRSPRAGNTIYADTGEEIGVVTSGTFSPGLERGIGLGFVAEKYFSIGKKLFIGDGKNKLEAEIVGRPIYKKGSLKN